MTAWITQRELIRKPIGAREEAKIQELQELHQPMRVSIK